MTHECQACGSIRYSEDKGCIYCSDVEDKDGIIEFMEELGNSFVIHAFRASCRSIQAEVHQIAIDKGWYSDGEHNLGELIALCHAELSEALEALRHGNPPAEHIKGFSAVEEELADVVIRVLDLAAYQGYRVGDAIIAKMEFNKTRPERHGGKCF